MARASRTMPWPQVRRRCVGFSTLKLIGVAICCNVMSLLWVLLSSKLLYSLPNIGVEDEFLAKFGDFQGRTVGSRELLFLSELHWSHIHGEKNDRFPALVEGVNMPLYVFNHSGLEDAPIRLRITCYIREPLKKIYPHWTRASSVVQWREGRGSSIYMLVWHWDIRSNMTTELVINHSWSVYICTNTY